MNRLFQQLNPQVALPNNPAIANIKQMMNTYRMLQNPQQFINSNPQIQQAMQTVKQMGGNPKEAFYALAKQRGVDPDAIIKQLTN